VNEQAAKEAKCSILLDIIQVNHGSTAKEAK
jgi:hypothetical protein